MIIRNTRLFSENREYVLTDSQRDRPPVIVLGEGILADTVQVFGERLLADTARKTVHENIRQLPIKSAESLTLNERFEPGTIFILCPDQADFGMLFDLNSFFLKHRHPFALCYFDGKQVVAGPSVLPGLTPCFACYMEHRRKKFFAARPLPDTPRWRTLASEAAELIVCEADRLHTEKKRRKLTGIQTLFPLQSSSGQPATKFFLTSSCPSCLPLPGQRKLSSMKRTSGHSARQNEPAASLSGRH